MKITLTLVLSSLLIFSGSNLWARGSKKPDAMDAFYKLDTNGDRKITVDELSKAKSLRGEDKNKVGGAFKKADANNDGAIQAHEWRRAFPDRQPEEDPRKRKVNRNRRGGKAKR